MSKKLDRLYIRMDALFPGDERFQALPRAIRDSAYLYFGALNGWCRDRARRRALNGQTGDDSRMPLAMAYAVGRTMDHGHGRVDAFLAALSAEGVELLYRDGDEVVIPKYSKWQDTSEEITRRRGAGKAGGQASGAARKATDRSTDRSLTADDSSSDSATDGEPTAEGVVNDSSSYIARERVGEIETASLSREGVGVGELRDSVPPQPPKPPGGGPADGLSTERPDVRAYGERFAHHGRQPSADDLVFLRRIPYEFDRLGESAVLAAIDETAKRFLDRAKGMPPAKYLAGKLGDLQVAASDAGARPRATGPSAGFTRVGDALGGVL